MKYLPEATQAFGVFQNMETDISESAMATVEEQFVVLLYDRTSGIKRMTARNTERKKL